MLGDATGPVRFLENGLRDRERRMGLVDRDGFMVILIKPSKV